MVGNGVEIRQLTLEALLPYSLLVAYSILRHRKPHSIEFILCAARSTDSNTSTS